MSHIHHRSTSLIFVLILALLFGGLAPPRVQTVLAHATAANERHTFLPLIMGGAGTVQVSSAELIDRDIAAGKLDQQTGLMYKVFAAFDDQRLPAQYRGDGRSAIVPGLTAASEQLASLRPEIRAGIAPFLLPPNASGSWLELREGASPSQALATAASKHSWVSLGPNLAPPRPYRIWYRPTLRAEETVRAARVLAAMDNRIWPKLTALMGPPLPDGDVIANGAGPEFDIYLVDSSSKTVPYAGRGCSQNAAYVLLDTNDPDEDALAARVMLAILYGYKVGGCREYGWLFQASATWAADYVYPDHQQEQIYANALLSYPDLPLEQDHSDLIAPLSRIGLHDTGQYLLPFYLARKLGQPERVRAIWEAAGAGDSLAAVNGTLPGGFEKLWPDFALANWNRPPQTDYQKLDGLETGASSVGGGPVGVALQGATDRQIPLADEIAHLAVKYHHLVFNDPAVTTVTFYNGFDFNLSQQAFTDETTGQTGEALVWKDVDVAAKKGSFTQALLKINGAWTVETWTNQPYHTFCRDNPAERLEELVLIFSNSDHTDRKRVLKPTGLPSRLVASNIGCMQWSGKSGRVVVADGTREESWADGLRWTRVAPVIMSHPGGGQYLGMSAYQLNGGTAYGKALYRYFCSGKGSGSGPVGIGQLFVYTHTVGGKVHRTYWGGGVSPVTYDVFWTGDPSCAGTSQVSIGSWFVATPEALIAVKPDGKTMEHSYNPDSAEETYSWNLSSP